MSNKISAQNLKMLSIKRLPALSASKIQPKQNFLLRNTVVDRHINKQCQNDLVNLCRSFSMLHSLTSKSRNPVSLSSCLKYYLIE